MVDSAKKSFEGYTRYLEPGFTPFDPLELAKQTEHIVCDGNRRKSRDFPEKHGSFKSPEEVFDELSRMAGRKRVDQLRISGSEPTLGKSHLLNLLELVERSPFRLFILETNGILIGADSEYAQEIARFKKVHARVALKAGTPKAFTKKTGAKPEFFELPFQGIKNLLSAGVSCHIAAMSADSRFMTKEERKSLFNQLEAIHPALVRNLEEEIVTPYPAARERLKYAGVEVDWD